MGLNDLYLQLGGGYGTGENGSFENGIREIFVQIFGKDSNTVKSVNKILESFFGENGAFGKAI